VARFDLVQGESEVLVRAHTSLETVTMKTTKVVGYLDAEMAHGGVFLAVPVPSCRIELSVAALHSGNPFFDREGRRRFDAAHYPLVAAQLVTAIPLGAGKHRVTWRVSLHGATRDLDGDVWARVVNADAIRVDGEHRFDVRHWGVEPGGLLGIRVHPEASFAVRLLARRQRIPRGDNW
jgi:hypothetical protein